MQLTEIIDLGICMNSSVPASKRKIHKRPHSDWIALWHHCGICMLGTANSSAALPPKSQWGTELAIPASPATVGKSMFTPARMCLNEFVQVGGCGGNAYSATEWAILYIYILYIIQYIYTVYDGDILRMLLSDVCFTKWQNVEYGRYVMSMSCPFWSNSQTHLENRKGHSALVWVNPNFGKGGRIYHSLFGTLPAKK